LGTSLTRLLAARAAQGVVIVFVVATLTFVLVQVAPGNPFTVAAESGRVAPEVIEQQRRNFGLDRPIHEQYLRYLANLIRGDFGYSFTQHRPVREAFVERVPNTLLLAAAGLVIMFPLGVLIGVFQGSRPGSRSDDTLSVATLVVYSTPVFWLGLMLLLVFGQTLHWFPIAGPRDPVVYQQLTWLGRVVDRLRHLVLPAVTLGLVGAAVTARYQRAAMLDVIRREFVRTARAKGLEERAVIVRHALRNALLPTITLFGLAFPLLLSGAVLVESVFAWPGLGRLAVNAIHSRDYAVVTGAAIVTATMVVLGNLLADVLYRLVDPRTRPA
jgi:peptide/nickel transport system permease protein